MKHHLTNIILSLFSNHVVLKCAAKSMKIGLQIKIYRPKMVLKLNMDFCKIQETLFRVGYIIRITLAT